MERKRFCAVDGFGINTRSFFYGWFEAELI